MSLARSLFYAWEKRLAFKDDPERRVLDFQWGAEFLPPFGSWHPVPSIYSSASPMGRKSALRREIAWILRRFQRRLSC